MHNISFQEIVENLQKDYDENLASEFYSLVYDLNLIINDFQWMEWVEGKKSLQEKALKPECLSLQEILQYFTLILRAERFNEGFMKWTITEGLMLKLVVALLPVAASLEAE